MCVFVCASVCVCVCVCVCAQGQQQTARKYTSAIRAGREKQKPGVMILSLCPSEQSLCYSRRAEDIEVSRCSKSHFRPAVFILNNVSIKGFSPRCSQDPRG